MERHSIQNQEFYGVLCQITKKCLDLISNQNPDSIPKSHELKWERQEGNHYIRQSIQKYHWSFILNQILIELNQKEELNALIKIVEDDKTISKHINTLVGTNRGQSRIELNDFVLKTVSKFFDTQQVLIFNQKVFDEAYFSLEKDLYTDKVDFEIIFPLYGFSSDISIINFEKNISLEKLSEKEVINFLDFGIKMGGTFSSENFIHNIDQFALKLKYSLPKIIGEEYPTKIKNSITHEIQQREQIREIFNILKIFKEGFFFPVGEIRISKSLFNDGMLFRNYLIPASYENKYHLMDSELKDLNNLWISYKDSLSNSTSFQIAIRRFFQSTERSHFEDKIIDLFICGEALFVGEKGEVTYKLSQRVALFIIDDKQKQKEIFQFMKKAYSLRSDIVHGNINPKFPKKKDGSKYNLYECYKQIEFYFRIALKKMIDLKGKVDWDSILFSVESK